MVMALVGRQDLFAGVRSLGGCPLYPEVPDLAQGQLKDVTNVGIGHMLKSECSLNGSTR